MPLFIALLMFTTVAFGDDWTLPALESQLEAALNYRIAAAETDVYAHQVMRQQADTGWKILSGAIVSDNNEPTEAGSSRKYQALVGRIGLRHPLLGSRLEEQLALLRAETDLASAQAREDMARRTAVELLRRAYISYWENQRKLHLSRDYLDQEDAVRNILNRRRQKGLLLEADRLEFLTTFERARRGVTEYQGQQADELAVIDLLTNAEPERFIAHYPNLPSPCLREADMLAASKRHPELVSLAARIDERADRRHFAATLPIESGVNFNHALIHEEPASITGSSTSISVDFRMPLDVFSASAARRGAAHAELSKARLEYQLREKELHQLSRRLIAQHRTRKHSTRFAQARLSTVDERVRERDLRARVLPGDVLEQLQQARYEYYLVALDAIEAEAALLETEAQLLTLAPAGCAVLASNVPAAKSASQSRGNGVYVWDSAALLDPTTVPESVWQAFERRGHKRILLSLDGRQIQSLSRSAPRNGLSALIDAASTRGFSVELLLAEPSWMLPAHRDDLLAIIIALKPYAFAALHLDLEPNQIDAKQWSEAAILDELLVTLAAVKQISPWPIGFSVHPRYMRAETSQGVFGEQLAPLGIDEITLMVYVTNPQRVYEISKPLLEKYPATKFSVAQSIEDFLAPEETHAGIGEQEFLGRMDKLEKLFQVENFSGVLVQAWRYFRYMSP